MGALHHHQDNAKLRRESGRPTGVTMMEATDLGKLDDLPVLRWLDRSRLRRILLQRQMRSRTMVVADVSPQDSAKMTLVEDDDVIETLSPDRADDTLDVGILPWRAACCSHLLDAESTDASAEGAARPGRP